MLPPLAQLPALAGPNCHLHRDRRIVRLPDLPILTHRRGPGNPSYFAYPPTGIPTVRPPYPHLRECRWSGRQVRPGVAESPVSASGPAASAGLPSPRRSENAQVAHVSYMAFHSGVPRAAVPCPALSTTIPRGWPASLCPSFFSDLGLLQLGQVIRDLARDDTVAGLRALNSRRSKSPRPCIGDSDPSRGRIVNAPNMAASMASHERLLQPVPSHRVLPRTRPRRERIP